MQFWLLFGESVDIDDEVGDVFSQPLQIQFASCDRAKQRLRQLAGKEATDGAHGRKLPLRAKIAVVKEMEVMFNR